MAEFSVQLTRRVFLLYSDQAEHPVGTCFGIAKPGLLLTARHALEGTRESLIRVVSVEGHVDAWPLEGVRHHPEADVSALYVAQDRNRFGYFDMFPASQASLGIGYTELALGDDVISFGYPLLANERPVNPRLMKAHIQSCYPYHSDPYRYEAYELAFPAFPGQSGAPVLRDRGRDTAVGIVTEGVRYSSEIGEERTEACWTVAAALTPLADWIDSL